MAYQAARGPIPALLHECLIHHSNIFVHQMTWLHSFVWWHTWLRGEPSRPRSAQVLSSCTSTLSMSEAASCIFCTISATSSSFRLPENHIGGVRWGGVGWGGLGWGGVLVASPYAIVSFRCCPQREPSQAQGLRERHLISNGCLQKRPFQERAAPSRCPLGIAPHPASDHFQYSAECERIVGKKSQHS